MVEQMKTVFVTGATGFVGRHLCARLKTAGFAVVAVGRRASAGPWDRFLGMDLATEAPSPHELKGVWGIFHVAGLAHVTACRGNHNPYRALCVEATGRLLAAAREAGVSRFLYMSSVKAMGEGNPPGVPLRPMGASSVSEQLGPYGRAKREGEQLVLESRLSHAVVLRPAMVFGPGGKGNLPRMEAAIARRRFPPLPETGNRRSMVHVDDLAELALRALLRPVAAGKTYIVCHPVAVSTRQLYDALRDRLGMGPVSVTVPMGALKVAAISGSAIAWISRRTVPFDREVLSKLTGSAWYDAALAEVELDYVPRHGVLEWIREATDYGA